ncbi:hypothetical protein MIND_00918200 [Mycena indigotica]|uniref:F-box domain-containing protein n=1 Tax=Mycena indigotica TaxID=2126181 RepID=A0A8H6SCF9_9AGAR|nr:uncharacterized protein MIND_00918200 [Mycena indigotica]KAF7296869.1 hypothetical protein MIND_00918200 [Mycena indigotica]
MTVAPPLPVELVAAIAECAPPSSLATLAAACRLFRVIAEDYLYPRVVLDQRNAEQGFFWCRTVIENHRLARKVSSLVFNLLIIVEDDPDEMKKRLVEEMIQALRVCTKLTRLNVGLDFCVGIPSTLGEFLGPGCPLRLTHLHLGDWKHITDLDAVWMQQVAITSLVIPGPLLSDEWNADSAVVNLPLKNIYAPLSAVIPAEVAAWKLEHALLSITDEDEELPSFLGLGSYASTLTILAMESHSVSEPTIHQLLSLMADSLPNLTTLSYDETVSLGNGARKEGAIQRPLARFARLASFFLRIHVGLGSLVFFWAGGPTGKMSSFHAASRLGSPCSNWQCQS